MKRIVELLLVAAGLAAFVVMVYGLRVAAMPYANVVLLVQVAALEGFAGVCALATAWLVEVYS